MVRLNATSCSQRTIDTNKISAEYRDGMLEITAPILAEALPRHVEIKNVQESTEAQR